MKKENLESLTQKLEKAAAAKQKRKKRKMRVSGKSVFSLQRIIRRKSVKH